MGFSFLTDLFERIQKTPLKSKLQIHLPTVAHVVCAFSIGAKFLSKWAFNYIFMVVSCHETLSARTVTLIYDFMSSIGKGNAGPGSETNPGENRFAGFPPLEAWSPCERQLERSRALNTPS